MLIYLNKEIVPIENAKLSITDHGLLYGFGLFITVRAYNGHLFLINDHLQKLQKGMKEIGIQADGTEKFEQAMKSTMKANRINNGKVRLTVTAGSAGWRKPRTPYTQPNVFVFARPLSMKRPDRHKSLTVLKIPLLSPKVPYKSLSRMSYLYGFRELQLTKADEGLLLTENGEVAEGLSSNIFIIRRGVITTPPISTGIIAGVTRGFVIRLAKRLDLPVKEQTFGVKELAAADEIFMTNSMQEIVTVSHIDNIYESSKTPISDSLLQHYKRYTSQLRSVSQL